MKRLKQIVIILYPILLLMIFRDAYGSEEPEYAKEVAIQFVDSEMLDLRDIISPVIKSSSLEVSSALKNISAIKTVDIPVLVKNTMQQYLNIFNAQMYSLVKQQCTDYALPACGPVMPKPLIYQISNGEKILGYLIQGKFPFNPILQQKYHTQDQAYRMIFNRDGMMIQNGHFEIK